MTRRIKNMVIIIIMVRNDAKDEKIMWIMSIRMMCRVKNNHVLIAL